MNSDLLSRSRTLLGLVFLALAFVLALASGRAHDGDAWTTQSSFTLSNS